MKQYSENKNLFVIIIQRLKVLTRTKQSLRSGCEQDLFLPNLNTFVLFLHVETFKMFYINKRLKLFTLDTSWIRLIQFTFDFL